MAKITMVELPTVSESGKICIRPYFDPNKENMGLEKYGMSLFENVFHTEQLGCVEEVGGVRRYLTGLNPFAPEIKRIADKEEREAKIKQITAKVAALEAELAANIIDAEDPQFWNKVKLLRPDNDEFWSKIEIKCGNQAVPLDPATNPYDAIKLYAIEAGGFSIVAKSLDDARSRPTPPKFYLDKVVDTVATKTEVKKLRNAALAELENLRNSNPKKLLYVAKMVDSNSVQYKNNTPIDVIYDNMDRYILGEGVERNAKRAAESFLSAAKESMEDLKLKVLVKDAAFYKIISHKSDGRLYHMQTNSMMGANIKECVEYLKDPVNDKILGDILKIVESYWKK